MDRLGHELSSGGEEISVAGAAKDPRDLVPLAVDLDGTLISTDTLFESALSLIRQKPLAIFWMAAWLLRGKAVLKSELARRFQPSADNLPYRAGLLDYLRQQRAAGRTLVLATASHRSTADSVAAHLGLFDEVLATSDTVNLKGALKRDELVKRYGLRGFDYIGDSKADIPVWSACRTGLVAGRMEALPGAARAAGAQQGEVFPSPRPSFKTWLRSMRVYQWVKNVLVFVAPLLNHHIDATVLKEMAVAFLGFSFVASGTYVANDLFDLAADRKHPRKCKRPLASGELSIAQGIALSVGLVTAGILLSLLINKLLLACLLIYLVLTLLYSSFLKGKPILDAVVLAVLYTLRIYSGGLATGAYVSPWLFQFSMFLFLSLAFVKRYSEVRRLRYNRRGDTPGRNYRLQDLSIISQAGIGSGLMAGLVLALYVNGREIERLYPRPEALWGVCPLFVYWIIRVWLIAHRGNMNEDPILYAFGDRVSYIVGFLIVLFVLIGLIPQHVH